jgi:hypothetical protein
VGFHQGARALNLHIVTTQRRATIARDETRSIEARFNIAPLLIQGQADKGLDACQESATFVQLIFVSQQHFAVAHHIDFQQAGLANADSAQILFWYLVLFVAKKLAKLCAICHVWRKVTINYGHYGGNSCLQT